MQGPVTDSLRVLLVEDEPALARLIERTLSEEGYAVVVALDGESALLEANLRSPDLVVLDVGLPRMSGLEVCRRLRAQQHSMPILMLAARDAVPDRVA